MAKVTHQPRPSTIHESTPSRGSRDVPAALLWGLAREPPSLISGLLENLIFLINSLILVNSFSAHTRFQLFATEDSASDRWGVYS